jgi:MFS family permease
LVIFCTGDLFFLYVNFGKEHHIHEPTIQKPFDQLGVIYLASIVMIGRYFSKKRGLASGLAYCGSGVGGFLFAPLMESLIAEYTWQGAVWVVSAIVLNCVPLEALLKHLNTLENDEKPGQTESSNNPNQSECSFIQEALNELKLFKTPCFIIYGASCFLYAIGRVNVYNLGNISEKSCAENLNKDQLKYLTPS